MNFQFDPGPVPAGRAELAGGPAQAGRVGHPGGRDGSRQDRAGDRLPRAPEGDRPGQGHASGRRACFYARWVIIFYYHAFALVTRFYFI